MTDFDAIANDFEAALRMRLEGKKIGVNCVHDPDYGCVSARFRRWGNPVLDMDIMVSKASFESFIGTIDGIAAFWADRVIERFNTYDAEARAKARQAGNRTETA